MQQSLKKLLIGLLALGSISVFAAPKMDPVDTTKIQTIDVGSTKLSTYVTAYDDAVRDVICYVAFQSGTVGINSQAPGYIPSISCVKKH